MEKRDRVEVFNVNVFFLLMALSFLLLGPIVQSGDQNIGIIITEYGIILLPNILYLLINKVDLKKALRLNKVDLKEVVMVILIMLVAYPIGAILNAIVVSIFGSLLDFNGPAVDLPHTLVDYLKSLLIVGLTPGICEEIMFRGTFLSAYEKLGSKKAILYSAILFGLFHFNIFNFIGPAFLGYVLGTLVYRSNSIFVGILGHTLNNSIAMSLGYYLNKQMNEFLLDENMMEIMETQSPSLGLGLGAILIIVGIFIGLLIILKKLFESFPDKSNQYEELEIIDKMGIKALLPIFITVGLFIFLHYKIYLL